jgi:hypothetical protein
LHARIEALPPDERAIIDSLLTRIELGRRQYGPWVIDDGRDYPSETFAELIDGLHYCAAELVRQQRRERQRRRRVYVCHPYSADPVGNAKKVGELCRQLIAEGVLPIAPQLYLPAFIDETTERELALELCQELVDLADEVSVFDTQLTSGMGRELDRAKWRQIPIKNRKRVQP